MNPVPRPSFDKTFYPIQNIWNGVNVPNLPEGTRLKATEVSPWFGVYLTGYLILTLANQAATIHENPDMP